MKFLLSSICIGLLTLFSGHAQQLENALLWKISVNNLEKSSYLFGTIHITCDASLNDDVTLALEETTQIVLEIDMDDPSLQSKMMGGIYMKDGKKISELISKEDYAIIDAFVTKEIGASLNMLETMKPFMIYASLYPKMLDCPMQSYELELMKVAKTQDEEVLGLETVEDQLQVFDDIPYIDQVNDLLKTAKDNMAYDKASLSKVTDIYKAQNITEMLKMMNDDYYSSVSKHQDKLLTNRNKNWISKISEYTKDQPTFFGVGAGHLAGENGVIKLLRKAGFTVEAVQ